MTDKKWSKGDVVEGKVMSLDHQGAWVNAQGEKIFLPLAEISWYEIEHPSEIMSVGELVLVSIQDKDTSGTYRASLRQVRDEVDENLIIDVVVTIPKGGRNKYEFNHDKGTFRLKRILPESMFYPFEYGFIEQTLAADGNPLDVMILMTTPTFPGCVIECRILGLLRMQNTRGANDKLLGVPMTDPKHEDVYTLSDLHQNTLREIAHFFHALMALEIGANNIEGWMGEAEAKKVILEGKEKYLKNSRSF